MVTSESRGINIVQDTARGQVQLLDVVAVKIAFNADSISASLQQEGLLSRNTTEFVYLTGSHLAGASLVDVVVDALLVILIAEDYLLNKKKLRTYYSSLFCALPIRLEPFCSQTLFANVPFLIYFSNNSCLLSRVVAGLRESVVVDFEFIGNDRVFTVEQL